MLYALDPGPKESALVILASGAVVGPPWVVVLAVTAPNEELLPQLKGSPLEFRTLVIEQIASFGMPVGAEVFETCFWSGRFYETWPGARHRLPRSAVKLHLCGSMRAKDAHIRQALLDRFGGSSAKGTIKNKGPLYGLKSHQFAALAVGVTWLDQNPAIAQNAANAAEGAFPEAGRTVAEEDDGKIRLV